MLIGIRFQKEYLVTVWLRTGHCTRWNAGYPLRRKCYANAKKQTLCIIPRPRIGAPTVHLPHPVTAIMLLKGREGSPPKHRAGGAAQAQGNCGNWENRKRGLPQHDLLLIWRGRKASHYVTRFTWVRAQMVGFASPMPSDAQFPREGQGYICSGLSNLASAGPSQSGIFLEHAITKGREKGRISESMPEVLGRSVCHTNMWNRPENNFLRREGEGFFSFLCS